MEDCIFCKIAAGEIPSKKVFENDRVLTFYDLNPVAKFHVLVIPKTHICCANMITADNSRAVADCFEAIAQIAKEQGLAEDGYRIINNCGENAGQTVKHLHFHMIGGQKLPINLL